ncbi:MAG: hypothetical protein Q4A16_01430 [Lautropia sp.]|nr:hypothetical protein [Lautropia sp.]
MDASATVPADGADGSSPFRTRGAGSAGPAHTENTDDDRPQADIVEKLRVGPLPSDRQRQARRKDTLRKSRQTTRHAVPAATPSSGNPRHDTAHHELRVLSLNAEHLMSRTRFEHWRQFCSRHHWQEPQTEKRPPGLTYCDALSGRNQQGQLIHAPVRTLADLDAKIHQLAALVQNARPDLVLMQEVGDREAAAQVLGQGWTIHTSAERWQGRPIAQHLVLAWRSGHFVPEPRVELIEAISQQTEDGHVTRPGLAAYLDLPSGLNLAVLNVHLKAGCRHGRLERSISRQPTRYWRRLNACRTLQAQIPALESWVDRQIEAGRQVLISGDFNRDLHEELKTGMPARADGSPAGQLIHRAEDARRISSLLAEIDDDTPPGARFALIRNGPYRRHADCHRHITPFLLSHGLAEHLQQPLERLSVQVLPFDAPLSLARPRPSDHCPHLLALPLAKPVS